MTAKTVRAVIGVLVDIVIVLVLISNLYGLVMRNVAHEPLPKILGYGFAVVVSGSMSPEFDADDVVYIKESPSYSAGDIITFVDEDSPSKALVTHRIVYVTDEGYITKGDANPTSDEGVVSPDAVLGKVFMIVPYLGATLLWLRTPVGMLSLVLMALLLIELPYQIRTRTKKASEETIAKMRNRITTNTSAGVEGFTPDLVAEDEALLERTLKQRRTEEKRQARVSKKRKRSKIYVPEEGQWNIDL